MRRVRLAPTVLALGLALPSAAHAQGDEAPPPARGVLRVLLPPVWGRWNQRFGGGTAGRAAGELEPLGVDFQADSLGVAQLPFLAPAQTALRAATGLSAYAVNLGTLNLQLNANVRAMPIGFALGVTPRLSVSVLVPLVRSRVEAFFQRDTTLAARGNVGWNPGVATPGSYDAFRQQVDSALLALRAQAASGPAALRAQAQAALALLGPVLCNLFALAGGSAIAPTSACYAAVPVAAAPLLPVETTAAGDSIATRLGRARTSYEELAALYAGAGVALPAFTAPYALPQAPLTRDDFQRFLMDSAAGAGGDSLAMVLHTRLGDVQAAATYLLVERPRWRSLVTATVRLPTGMVDSDRNFIDVGTGDHTLGVELSTRNDVALGRSFRIVAGGRIGFHAGDQLYRRISPVQVPFAPFAHLAQVRRSLSSWIALDVTPTWLVDDAFSLGVRYAYFNQGPTHFRYVDAGDSARVGLPASVLDAETAERWMRAGANMTFSTLRRFAAGQATLPYTVTIGYQNTFWGRGGRTPQTSLMYLTFATYFRLFGSGAGRGAW
jgi:hypothetical protein